LYPPAAAAWSTGPASCSVAILHATVGAALNGIANALGSALR
jgi:hypothetical protein